MSHFEYEACREKLTEGGAHSSLSPRFKRQLKIMDLRTRRPKILQDLRLFGLAEKQAVTLADLKRQRDQLQRTLNQ